MQRPVQVDSPGRSWAGERVLVRADLNAPLDTRRVTDDARIRASVATIRYLLDNGAAVAVCSHLGRPNGTRIDDLSLAPCAERLSELLGQPVELLADCVGPVVEARVRALQPGDVVRIEIDRLGTIEHAIVAP